MDDIDWDNAECTVCGVHNRATKLMFWAKQGRFYCDVHAERVIPLKIRLEYAIHEQLENGSAIQ